MGKGSSGRLDNSWLEGGVLCCRLEEESKEVRDSGDLIKS